MLHILYTQIPDDDASLGMLDKQFNQVLPFLPVSRKTVLQKIRHTRPRVTSGLGLLLLRLGMHRLGIQEFQLRELVYSSTRKPFCPGRFDFNISHSHSLVVCGIASQSMIGIDTEKIRDFSPEKFDRLLRLSETETAGMNLIGFFDAWTKKEAVVKAEGNGGVWDIGKVKLSGSNAEFCNLQWYLRPINLAKGYVTNIASNNKIEDTDIELTRITVEELLNSIPSQESL